MELHVVTYDMHPLRDLLAGRGEPFEFEVLFHPWLFPDLEYRQTRDAKVEVAESGRWLGRAQLRALTVGGAVWDAFRENANCGDPVGNCGVTVGSAYISPGLNWENPAKFRQIWPKFSENLTNFR